MRVCLTNGFVVLWSELSQSDNFWIKSVYSVREYFCTSNSNILNINGRRLIIGLVLIGMVPDDTVHKGASKCHNTDEKSTNFVVHVSPSIFGFF